MSEAPEHLPIANAKPPRPIPVKLGITLNLGAAIAFLALYSSRNVLFLFGSGAGNLIWTDFSAVILLFLPMYLLIRIYRAKTFSRAIYFVTYAMPTTFACIWKLSDSVIFKSTDGAPIVASLIVVGSFLLVVPSSNRWFGVARQSVDQSSLLISNIKPRRPFFVTLTIILNFLMLLLLFPLPVTMLLSLLALGTVILTSLFLAPPLFSTLHAPISYGIFLAFFSFLFPTFLLINMLFRRNWARWTYAVSACSYVCCSFYRWTVAPPSQQAPPIFALIVFLFPLAFIAMLFLPASNRWFGARAA